MLNAFFYNLVPAYFDEIREQKQINARYRRKRILEATLNKCKRRLTAFTTTIQYWKFLKDEFPPHFFLHPFNLSGGLKAANLQRGINKENA